MDLVHHHSRSPPRAIWYSHKAVLLKPQVNTSSWVSSQTVSKYKWYSCQIKFILSAIRDVARNALPTSGPMLGLLKLLGVIYKLKQQNKSASALEPKNLNRQPKTSKKGRKQQNWLKLVWKLPYKVELTIWTPKVGRNHQTHSQLPQWRRTNTRRKNGELYCWAEESKDIFSHGEPTP